MRIIAGKWRGRVLKSPAGQEVRPTTDRTKEALFNILGPDIRGCVVLDLCCGAGGLGLEALSRGAEHVVFLDQSRTSLALARSNLELCGAEAGTWVMIPAEAVFWLQRWPGSGGRPWILLCDPPYQSGAAASMMTLLAARQVPDGLLTAVVEHGPRTPDLPTLTPDWETRRYGESHLAIYRPGAAVPEQENRP